MKNDLVNVFKPIHCIFATKFKQSVQKHIQIHMSSIRIKLFKCTFAPKSKGYLNMHKISHIGIKDFIAFNYDKCFFVTKYKVSLQSRFLAHQQGEEGNFFKCNRCSFATRRKGNLLKHLQIHSKKYAEFQCDLCT